MPMSLDSFDGDAHEGELNGEPTVRIGLLQAVPEVLVNLHGQWSVTTGSGMGRFGSRRIADLHLKFRFSPLGCKHTSRRRYTVKLSEFFSTESITRWLPVLKKIGVDGNLSILEAGRLWSIRGKTWDARTRWVVAGDYGSLEEAGEASREWSRELSDRVQAKPDLFWPLVEPGDRLKSTEPAGAVEVRIGDELFRDPLIRIEPLSSKSYFSIYDVIIGKQFHWEHRKTVRYVGKLMLMGDDPEGITVVNELPIESYLESVTSSEASLGAPDEYLKAQCVAARSTVLATVSRHHRADPFDLCAEDHCQCYYGTDVIDKKITRVLKSMRGLVRVMGYRPADCRYSKICGGKSENYSDVWGGEPVPYLVSRSCGGGRGKEAATVEEVLDPAYNAYCNPKVHKYPNSLEHAKNLFRWEQEWQAKELADQVEEVLNAPATEGGLRCANGGTHLATIRELRPLTRGASGRITRLLLVGSEGEATIRGELAIRKLLSRTHLPSSMFVVESNGGDGGFRLRGGGWGHGVGMCQLGGIALARTGISFDRILDSYYPGTITDRLW